MAAQRRVLIVDDEHPFREALKESLRVAGYEIAEAADGPSALQQCSVRRPDAVLLDIKLPGMDGYEVCRRLKTLPAGDAMPIIVVTAVYDSGLNRLAYDAGASACLTKPFRPEALLAILDAMFATAERQARPKTRTAQ